MAHEVESMAYRGATPWHGHGEYIPDYATLDDMMTLSRLDWTVSKREIFARGSDDRDKPLFGDFIGLDNRVAIVRDSDQYAFAVASHRYNPIQNREVVEFFRQYCEAGSMTLETLGSLRHGAIIWALASINKAFTLPGNDEVKGYLLLANSHDGSMSFSARFTSMRVVCMNTLSWAMEGTKADWSMRHSRKFTEEVAEDARKSLGLAVKSMQDFQQAAQVLSNMYVGSELKKLQFAVRVAQPDAAPFLTIYQSKFPSNPTTEEVDAVLAQIARDSDLKPVSIGPKVKGILAAAEQAPGAKLASANETYWGLVNGVTYYADHTAGLNRDSGLTSAWFGSAARLKERAVTTALDMAYA